MQLQITIFFKQVLLTVERNVVLSKIDCAIAWPDASETDAFMMKIKQHDMCKLASRVYTTVGENKRYYHLKRRLRGFSFSIMVIFHSIYAYICYHL